MVSAIIVIFLRLSKTVGMLIISVGDVDDDLGRGSLAETDYLLRAPSADDSPNSYKRTENARRGGRGYMLHTFKIA